MTAVRKADRLVNDVFHRVPDYLAWNAKAGGDASVGPTDAQLMWLLVALESLAAATESRDPANLAGIREQTSQLGTAQAEVERAASVLVAGRLGRTSTGRRGVAH